MKYGNLLVRQMFESESCTYTYLLMDTKTKDAVLIDSVVEKVDRDLRVINELGANLKYVIDTHVHADHVTGAGAIREKTKAKSAIGTKAAVGCVDVGLEDGDEIEFGNYKLKALATPGHTDGCTCYYLEGMVFTGDTLLIRGNGRTDFQQGSPETLYKSIKEKLFTLPEDTIVFPAHNYIGVQESSIGEEIQFNPRIGNGKTVEEFVEIMNNLNLPNPKKMDVAVPANMSCGKA